VAEVLGGAVVGVPICPLLAEPGEGSELADELLFGMSCLLLEEAAPWVRVRTGYGYEGYAPREALLEGDCGGWAGSVSHVVIRPAGDVAPAPEYRSRPFLTLPRGSLLAVVGVAQDPDWREVALPDGTRGFLRAETLRPLRRWGEADPEETRRRLAEDALLYLGAQYRWGGKTPQGIDCSGLCSMAYLLNGLAIYRDAGIREGFPIRPIREDRAKRGDLLFWPGHVALYLGEGRYVHSTGKLGGVGINSLRAEDPEYREDLVPVQQWGSAFPD
jgi:hypothetical protein